MKVLILGASGIIGQHLRLCVPAGIEPIWCRQKADWLHRGVDLEDWEEAYDFLFVEKPDVIVNLAGESNTDFVEGHTRETDCINIELPSHLARYCDRKNAHYIHVSTQAVFNGRNAPYGAGSMQDPINFYGCQKAQAELALRGNENWTIARATFVLGIRPMPAVGRANPMESILSRKQLKQVSNRFFSPLFASDAARLLWKLAEERPKKRIFNLGTPVRTSRYEIALAAGIPVEQVDHESFPSLAARPMDTTYDSSSLHVSTLADGIDQCVADYTGREQLNIEQRAREIALFLGKTEAECLAELSLGFGPLHAKVNEDFRREGVEKTDEQLLEWYRKTEAYIWELSAYHADPGFNYMGMCEGITEGLKARGLISVLCLGDGIGDLSLTLKRAGLNPTYHDLLDSRTCDFAIHRFRMYLTASMSFHLAAGDNQDYDDFTGDYDAIVSLDFLEHVKGVRSWVENIYRALKPGGWFFAQNAFNCGSGPNGSIPMHLAENDHWEVDWDTMLTEVGFVQDGTSNWYRKPE